MRVAGLTDQGDWRFGKGRAVYKVRSEAVRQNVLTRLRSFTNDWFLDMDHGQDWLEIFSQKNNRDLIIATIEACVLETEGIKSIDRLEIISQDKRSVVIALRFTDLFDATFAEQVALP